MSQSPPGALHVHVAMQTDIGRRRQQNQDAIGQLVPDDPAMLAQWGQLVVLADGVGGLPGGDLASQYAVSTILSSYYDETYDETDPAKRLARAIAEANSVIYEEGQAQNPPATMATTVVAAVIRDRDLIIGSVGDSPAYLLRDDEVRQLTQDHNLENMQRAAGLEPTSDQVMGHKLVRALGQNERVKVDIITGRVRHADFVVLCSDGLTRYAPPDEIGGVVTDLAIEDAVAALVETANERGGADNISVIVLELLDESQSLLTIRDPMESWGQPRKLGRPRPLEAASVAGPGYDTARQTGEDGFAIPPNRDGEPGVVALLLGDALVFMRSNMVMTGVGLGVLLVVFVAIMTIIVGFGDDGSNGGGAANTPRPASTALTATTAAQVVLTDEANLAATQAEIARLTLTPSTATYTPSPQPTYGPLLADGLWVRVLEGDPITSYAEPALDAEEATPLVAGETFKVIGRAEDAPNGPWYQLFDSLGQEARWVNGPSLHQRIVAVGESGVPLPPVDQPLDVPPPGTAWRTPTQARTMTPAGTQTTTGTPPASVPVLVTNTPGGTRTPSPTPDIAYGVENWTVGDRVAFKADLGPTVDLCRVPDVTACDAGTVTAGATGIITDGPRAAGEHWWWEVELPDGRAGWVAQVLLGVP